MGVEENAYIAVGLVIFKPNDIPDFKQVFDAWSNDITDGPEDSVFYDYVIHNGESDNAPILIASHVVVRGSNHAKSDLLDNSNFHDKIALINGLDHKNVLDDLHPVIKNSPIYPFLQWHGNAGLWAITYYM